MPCEGSSARRRPWCQPARSSGGRTRSGCAGPQGAGGRGGPSPLCPPTPGRGACGGTLRLCPGLLNSAAIGVAGIPPDCLPPTAGSSPLGARERGGVLCPPGEKLLSGTKGGLGTLGGCPGRPPPPPPRRLPFRWDSGEGQGTDLGLRAAGRALAGGRSVSEERHWPWALPFPDAHPPP